MSGSQNVFQTTHIFFLKKILNVNKRLTAKHSINQHIIRGLIEALKMKKKRRKRDVRLNLMKKKKESQFFNLNKMQAVKDFQASKKEEKFKRQKSITEKRAQTVIN